ncbi:addiction module toxin, RelE/StbE family [Clostridia bacterium]|nr:addiction module toxin, RelE/StbE family [Clostridia bacterium]
MLEPFYTNKYKKQRKLLEKRGLDISLLTDPIQLLLEEKQLPYEYNDHKLVGNFDGYRECHIGGHNSDWALIYKIEKNILILTLVYTGSHSDLFK